MFDPHKLQIYQKYITLQKVSPYRFFKVFVLYLFTFLLEFKHCDIIRKAAEAGGLLVDAMVIQDTSKEISNSVPLMVVENGCGSPCIDFRQVSSELAAVAKDADLVITVVFS